MQRLSAEALRAVRQGLGTAPTVHEVAVAVRQRHPRLQGPDLVAAVHEVLADVAGLGPLRDAAALPGVTDVLVSGHDSVWVERDGGLQRLSAAWPDEPALRAFAVRLATAAGVRLDQLHPYADFLLPGGLRCHIVLPPLAAATTISVRVPQSAGTLTVESLVQGQPTQVGVVLAGVVHRRLSYLISGGTGSGKTTLLAAMLASVPQGERIVVVEDAAELGPIHPHCVRLRARPATSEGVGEVTLRTMVRQAMRMRPDRLVIGEVRGAEVVDLLAAMNTGHEGAAATIHANSAQRVPERVRSLGLLAGVSAAAIDAQFATAVQVVIHVERTAGVRRVAQVAVIAPDSGSAHPALSFDAQTAVPGEGLPALEALLGQSIG